MSVRYWNEEYEDYAEHFWADETQRKKQVTRGGCGVDIDDVLLKGIDGLVVQTTEVSIAKVQLDLTDGTKIKAQGASKKDHIDRFNMDVGAGLALARALESAARKLRKRVRVAENGGFANKSKRAEPSAKQDYGRC